MSKTIQSTKDYNKFELTSFNRDVKKVSFLEVSMRKEGWIDAYPMHVIKNGSNKLKIKAGHHRFEVAMSIGIPVKYVVCDDKASIHDLERATNPWSTNDYLMSFIRTGNTEYTAVKEYMEETGIPLGMSISLLGGETGPKSNKMIAFKDGRFKVGKKFYSEQIKDIVLHLRGCGVDFASASLFVQAIAKMLLLDEFSISKFKEKASTHRGLFEKQQNLTAYLDLIETVYNRASRNKKPISFLAVEASKERQRSFGRT